MVGGEWASGVNDPGYTGEGYQALQTIVDKIHALQNEKVVACKSMWDNRWFQEWARATFDFATHCRDTHKFYLERHEYFDTAATARHITEVRDAQELRTEALGMHYLMTRYNLERAPEIVCVTPDDKPKLAEFKFYVEEINRELDKICQKELSTTTDYGRRMLDDRRRHLQRQSLG